jgi:hypothetical protein
MVHVQSLGIRVVYLTFGYTPGSVPCGISGHLQRRHRRVSKRSFVMSGKENPGLGAVSDRMAGIRLFGLSF